MSNAPKNLKNVSLVVTRTDAGTSGFEDGNQHARCGRGPDLKPRSLCKMQGQRRVGRKISGFVL